jgi:hypothetical protein
MKTVDSPQLTVDQQDTNGLALRGPVLRLDRKIPMKYKLSGHARQEIERRKIPLTLLEAVLEKPDQVVHERGAAKVYQSKCGIGGKMFLLRAIVDDSVDPAVVVTAYRTTKIEKCWGKL